MEGVADLAPILALAAVLLMLVFLALWTRATNRRRALQDTRNVLRRKGLPRDVEKVVERTLEHFNVRYVPTLEDFWDEMEIAVIEVLEEEQGGPFDEIYLIEDLEQKVRRTPGIEKVLIARGAVRRK